MDTAAELDRVQILRLCNTAEVAAAVLLSFGPEDCILKQDLREAARAVRTRLKKQEAKQCQT